VELRILVLGAVGVLALKVFGSALVAQRRPLVSSTALGVGFVVTVALDALLIPPYAGIGASVASTIAYTIGGGVMIALFSRVLGANARELAPRLSDVRWIALRARDLRRRRTSTPEGIATEP
jgi:Na+-driven multidrug efflux pump